MKRLSVKSTRQLIAALMLLAWAFAGAHVALEHGGELAGSHFDAAAHDEHDDDDGPVPADGHHHHDLGAVTSAQFAKSVEQLSAPQWTPLYDQLIAQLAAMLRDAGEVRERSVIGDSPPDERASGWLLDCHTALPVRGPSLA